MGQLTPHQVLIQQFVELHPEEVARQLNDASTDEAVGVLQREDDCESWQKSCSGWSYIVAHAFWRAWTRLP